MMQRGDRAIVSAQNVRFAYALEEGWVCLVGAAIGTADAGIVDPDLVGTKFFYGVL